MLNRQSIYRVFDNKCLTHVDKIINVGLNSGLYKTQLTVI